MFSKDFTTENFYFLGFFFFSNFLQSIFVKMGGAAQNPGGILIR